MFKKLQTGEKTASNMQPSDLRLNAYRSVPVVLLTLQTCSPLICKVWSTKIPSLHQRKEVILLQHILSSQGVSIGSRHLSVKASLFGAACDRVHSVRKTVLCWECCLTVVHLLSP